MSHLPFLGRHGHFVEPLYRNSHAASARTGKWTLRPKRDQGRAPFKSGADSDWIPKFTSKPEKEPISEADTDSKITGKLESKLPCDAVNRHLKFFRSASKCFDKPLASSGVCL